MAALDIKTLLLTTGIVTISLALCMFYFAASQKTYPGFRDWALGILFFSLGMLLISLRGIIPVLISILIANLFLFLSPITIYKGFKTFSGKKNPILMHVVFAFILIPTFLYFTYFLNSLAVRSSLIAFTFTFYFSLVTHTLIHDIRKLLNKSCAPLIAVTTAIAVFFIGIGIANILAKADLTIFLNHLPEIQRVTCLGLIVLMILFCIGLIQLNYQRLEMDFNNSYMEIEKAMQAAEKATRAKSQFLANMSHEIRTPMNGVIGMLDLLMETGLKGQQKDYAAAAQQSADSLLILINDILDFSKMEAGMLDIESINFDFNVTIESVCDIFAVKAHQKAIEFACLIHQDVPEKLSGDPGRLRQILTNLLGNAIKFTEEGEIFLTVTRRLESAGKVELMFEIRDTGIGIPKKRIEDLFDSFSQADASTTRKYGGTGLGLAISKQLVTLMSGEIGAKSRPGKGSTFWFTALFDKQKNFPAPAPAPVFKNIQNSRILIVDDTPMNHEVFAAYLKPLGCISYSAFSGPHALEMMLQASGIHPFQIVIIDMKMPGMDGETLGQKIKQHPKLKNTMLIMISSVASRGDADKLKSIGFSGFLTKPVKKNQLQECISAALTMPLQRDPAHQKFLTSHTLKEEKRMKQQKERLHRILLVEDNKINQKVATIMLEKLGYSITAVDNGLKAVEFYQSHPDQVDLILMDIQMPVMSGEEATRKIRELEAETKQRIPIIALTANAMAGDKEQFLSAGMDAYLPKPVKKHSLLKVFSEL